MKRLYIERFYLNRADDEYPMTVRIILQMKVGVDGHLLEEAVAATRTRYPYLCVKLGVERDADGSEHYVYHDNPQPWKVTGCRQPVCLCSEEANEVTPILLTPDSIHRLVGLLSYVRLPLCPHSHGLLVARDSHTSSVWQQAKVRFFHVYRSFHQRYHKTLV